MPAEHCWRAKAVAGIPLPLLIAYLGIRHHLFDLGIERLHGSRHALIMLLFQALDLHQQHHCSADMNSCWVISL